LEIAFILLAVIVFVVTTIIFLILYRRARSEVLKNAPVALKKEIDENAFRKLREILSETKKDDLRKLLSELRSLKSEAEKVMRDVGGEAEGERSGDN